MARWSDRFPVSAIGGCRVGDSWNFAIDAAGERDQFIGAIAALSLAKQQADGAAPDAAEQRVGHGGAQAQAKAQGIDFDSQLLTLDNVPRALANFDTRGFIQIVAERSGGRLLGVQAVADQAGELIQVAALAIRNRMTVDDLAGQLFPYLPMVEGLKLCAQTFSKDVTQLSCCAG